MFRRKQVEEEPQIPYGTKRIRYYFDNDLGKMAYLLEQYVWVYVSYWKILSDKHDLVWAKRVAKHYNLEIPEKEEIE